MGRQFEMVGTLKTSKMVLLMGTKLCSPSLRVIWNKKLVEIRWASERW